VADILRFWVEEGVDAFRLDSITTISKPEGLPDAPTVVPGTLQPPHQLIFNGPDILTWLRELQDAKSDHPEVLVVGEGPGVTVEQAVDYLCGPDPALDLVLQWEHIDADPGSGGKWDEEWWTPAFFADTMTRWQRGLQGVGWNTLYLGNHDQPRQVSRFGSDDSLWRESATMLATAAYLLQGTPFIFQGEEIGMTNVDFERVEDFRDIESLNAAAQWRAEGMTEAAILALLRRKSRDNGRTPMQWDASPNAGFTEGVPWIGVNANHSVINVAAQRDDPQSVLCYYRKLIRLRKQLDVVREGTYSPVESGPDVYAYVRSLGSHRLYVVSNFSDRPRSMEESSWPGTDHGRVVLANYSDRVSGSWELRPFETFVVLVDTTDHHSSREVR
jgi:oligo-1,6-glucosidase